MNCPIAWLDNVCTAGGDLEPPLNPDIPAEYLQKPQKRPAPETYLPPPSPRAAFVPLKRRRAVLCEIDSPNRKRQRAPDRSKLPMPQSARAPARKPTGKTMGMEDVLGTVDHTFSAKQSATPRLTRQKRVTTSTLPTADLHKGPAPVLTPSVSEGYAEEDAEDVEDAELESTRASTTSKRSRSPTRRMVDLQIANKPVVAKTATSSADVPPEVRALYKTIQALARRSKGVIPLGIEAEVQQDAKGDLDDLEDYVAKTPDDRSPEQLKDEFKAMREIRDGTSMCKTKHLHEPSWNELVHSQMLKQAVLGRPGFSYYNITTAPVIKELVPGNEYGELLKGKMVDFAVTLGPPYISKDYIVNRLAASHGKLQRTINPSSYSPLCYEPIILSVETKSPEGGNQNGEVQLSVWAMAHFNRLRQLIQDPVGVTLPLLLIADARWKLYFASDSAHEIHLIDAVDIGTTADIVQCYTILEALRSIFKWVEETFVPWILNGLLPE